MSSSLQLLLAELWALLGSTAPSPRALGSPHCHGRAGGAQGQSAECQMSPAAMAAWSQSVVSLPPVGTEDGLQVAGSLSCQSCT